MTASCRSHSGRAAWRMAACMVCAVAWPQVGLRAIAVESDRDWSSVQLAWRGDPRPPADLPAGVSTEPPEPRPSRRATRRAARRGVPPGRPPVQPPTVAVPAAALQDLPETIAADPPAAAPAGGSAAPIAHRDQAYGAGHHQRQRFDIYIPAGCSGGGLPLVIWIQGDDWQGGAKSDCPLVWLVERGYAVASIGYRPSDVAVFPAQLDDCRAAVATILADAETWGVDRDRVCIVGSGAGGHLAALVGFSDEASVAAGSADRSPAESAAPPEPDVTAVCTIAAPVHLTTLGAAHDRGSSAASRLVGGPLPEIREAALAASPLVHVSADDPPTLVLHGRHDASVPVDQASRLHRSLQAAGVDSTLVILDAGHPVPLNESAPAGAELLQFLDRVLGPGQRPPAVEAAPGAQDNAARPTATAG